MMRKKDSLCIVTSGMFIHVTSKLYEEVGRAKASDTIFINANDEDIISVDSINLEEEVNYE